MKLRIQGNVIRFRLNRREVEQFSTEGRVESSIRFPAGGALTYAVEQTPGDGLDATYSPGGITIRVPREIAREWTETDRVSMTGMDSDLEIVVEKDFQCMHKGEGAKDPDAFPNPMARLIQR